MPQHADAMPFTGTAVPHTGHTQLPYTRYARVSANLQCGTLPNSGSAVPHSRTRRLSDSRESSMPHAGLTCLSQFGNRPLPHARIARLP
jgi:hypothetical protein